MSWLPVTYASLASYDEQIRQKGDLTVFIFPDGAKEALHENDFRLPIYDKRGRPKIIFMRERLIQLLGFKRFVAHEERRRPYKEP